MRKNKIGTIGIKSLALLVVLGAGYIITANLIVEKPAMAQDATAPNPKMAPIDEYLMTDQAAEIALARSAAPESISRDAEVLVLGRHGFEPAVKGKNGFVCIVERSWTSAADADFWSPKVRTPICYNAAAAHSVLLRNIKRSELILVGRTQAETDEAIVAAVAKKELPAMESGAMCYMMSKQGYGGDSVKHWPPHVHVLLFTDRPGNLGSESAGFSHYGRERRARAPERAPDYVLDRRATVVGRNGRSLSRAYVINHVGALKNHS
jgi:hypothetical protein